MSNQSVPTELAQALADAHLAASATPSNQRLGRELVEATSVEEVRPEGLTARVAGSSTRTVTIVLVGDDLAWRCTCSHKLTRPCKHVVAVAVCASRAETDKASSSGFSGV